MHPSLMAKQSTIYENEPLTNGKVDHGMTSLRNFQPKLLNWESLERSSCVIIG
jgi:hypothetical protein